MAFSYILYGRSQPLPLHLEGTYWKTITLEYHISGLIYYTSAVTLKLGEVTVHFHTYNSGP